MVPEKICYIKTNKNFRDQTFNRSPAKCWIKDFILPHNYRAQNFYRRFWQPSVKSINNTTGSHLVSCRVIPRPPTMKG